MNIQDNSSVGLCGLHRFTMFEPKNRQDELLLVELGKWAHESPKKMREFMKKCAHMLTKEVVKKNITVTSGRTWLAQIGCNKSTRTNNYITHFAIGDDTTPASESDTTLGNEVFRKSVSSAEEDGASMNIATFIGGGEANFAWEEWGHFVDGTATADSGVMFTHHIDSSINKTSPGTVTVDSIISLSDA